jgi:nicotinate-nucleotide pyrophosphorylase (carboxylating)
MYDARQVEALIDLWLNEDVGHYDLTSTLMIDADAVTTFVMNAREPMVVAGIEVAAQVFRRCAPGAAITILTPDASRAKRGDALARITGNARGLLTAERTALNIAQKLSGIATLTAQYVDAIQGTGAQMIDTRKTTPGLRMLEKHAVVCGGARNHRLGLDNGVMLKDNHIAVCGSIAAAVARARAAVPVLTRIEVECDRLDQIEEAVSAGADMLLLDNMGPEMLRQAVAIVAGRALTEASGGVRLETVRAIAETGVNFISSGKLTQAAVAVDIGLDAPA